MKIIQKSTGREFDVDFRKLAGEDISICPVCSHTRKKKTDKCLGFNHSTGVGRCNHCHEAFYVKTPVNQKLTEIAYVQPKWQNNTELSEAVVKWFEQRGIRQNTLLEMKVTEGKIWMPQTQKDENTIQFNYFRDGQLINVKYRDGRKNFRLHKDAELILYNLDSITDSTVIVEGEIDCLSYVQSGVTNCVSVPNGAGKNPNLQYLDNCIDRLEKVDRFYIATDNDEPGRILRDELIRRLGEDKCYLIDLRDCKDANEFLIKYGSIELADTIKAAKPTEITGIIYADSQRKEFHQILENGLPPGDAIGIPEFDRLLTFVPGYITTVTGIPTHGKSEFLDEILIRLALHHGWKFAIYSPENFPIAFHMVKMAEKLIGLSASKKQSAYNRMTSIQGDAAVDFIDKHFFFVSPKNEDFSVNSILEHARKLVRRNGIRGMVIDPWNKIEHKRPKGMNETEYIGWCLDVIDSFCQKNRVHTFPVVHPRKMSKRKDEPNKYEIPTLYDCNGSANFYNKSANGFTVYRNFDEGNQSVEIHVTKVKFKQWGEQGLAEFNYNIVNGRYSPIGKPFDQTNWLSETNNTTQSTMTANNDFLKQSTITTSNNDNGLENNSGFPF